MEGPRGRREAGDRRVGPVSGWAHHVGHREEEGDEEDALHQHSPAHVSIDAGTKDLEALDRAGERQLAALLVVRQQRARRILRPLQVGHADRTPEVAVHGAADAHAAEAGLDLDGHRASALRQPIQKRIVRRRDAIEERIVGLLRRGRSVRRPSEGCEERL